MLEIGIPVYQARDTLPILLDSLVSQTRKKFIVCLSIDGDGQDYSDIINIYENRGLNIRVINAKENGGPGIARQRVLDTTQCEFLMFADADDMLMPRAVEILFKGITTAGYDILRSSFIRESGNSTNDIVLNAQSNVVTWFHGKIYRVNYLKRINAHFLPDLRTDEDAYFNIIAWNCTENKGYIDEITYIWRDNVNSVTRKGSKTDYFIRTHMNYISGQVRALPRIYELNGSLNNIFVANTLINIYYYYMQAKFYKCDVEEMDNCISALGSEPWMAAWMSDVAVWNHIINTLKVGAAYDNNIIVFFQEDFFTWVTRLMKGEK